MKSRAALAIDHGFPWPAWMESETETAWDDARRARRRRDGMMTKTQPHDCQRRARCLAPVQCQACGSTLSVEHVTNAIRHMVFCAGGQVHLAEVRAARFFCPGYNCYGDGRCNPTAPDTHTRGHPGKSRQQRGRGGNPCGGGKGRRAHD